MKKRDLYAHKPGYDRRLITIMWNNLNVFCICKTDTIQENVTMVYKLWKTGEIISTVGLVTPIVYITSELCGWYGLGMVEIGVLSEKIAVLLSSAL